MSDTFFTSDPHYEHANIIRFQSRPYKDVDEMNRDLIEKHNSTVKPGDTVFMLGDFTWGTTESAEKLLNRLNGIKHYIRGNHDKPIEPLKHLFASYQDVKQIKVDKQVIWLSHYPHLSWPKQGHGAWHLYGHEHSNIEWLVQKLNLKAFDVGVDNHKGYPVSFEEVKRRMDKITFTPFGHHGKSLP